MHDIVIIGAGPAGLTAAIYARRAGKTVLVLEKDTFGGQITFSPKLENYPGFESISGNELAQRMLEQAMALGADIDMDTVTGIADGEEKLVFGENGSYACKAVIIAAGARHRRLGLPDEDRFIGSGVSFCAVCDGAFYRDRHVSCLFNTVVSAYEGGDALEALRLKNTASGEETRLSVDGAFLAIGTEPENLPFAPVAVLDPAGYIVSDERCLTETPGIYAAGDCRTKQYRQVATAVADGAAAALSACRFLDAREAENK